MSPKSIDLHCHSTHSDGLLAPAELAARAAGRGVEVWALTDHDEVTGLADARCAAEAAGMIFINGVELSVSWRDITLHIIGLRIDPTSSALVAGLQNIRDGRIERARRMGAALEAVGIRGAFEGAMALAGNPSLVSRTHFARFLVDCGHVSEVREVFRRYLTPGKPGYVEHEWATLEDAMTWIHGAQGVAVLAHPGRYKITRGEMRKLLTEFKDRGGDGIEVVTSNHTQAQVQDFTGFARAYGFLASCGSDFHGPGESWMDFGQLPPLPDGLIPVWQNWF